MARKQTKAGGGRSASRKSADKPKRRPALWSADAAQSAVGTVRVRMYRQGLGDCFLLSFPRAGQAPFHILVDCGVILGTPDAAAKMLRVVEDIATVTGGHLNVVVATHEHWDHLSGFIQAQELFDDMTIDEAWFAWTEDPTDSLAARLRQGQAKALAGLRNAAQKLTAAAARPSGDRSRQLGARVESLLDFFGAAGGQSTRDALSYLVKTRHKPARVRYFRPGDKPITLPDVAGVRVFVLGPPHDEKLIKRSNPTKTGREVYEVARQHSAPDTAFYAALGDGTDELSSYSQPFDERFRVKPDAARSFTTSYDDPADAWRRIDDDWLGVSERLALALDSDTNNTSLVLALELEPGGRVLLFPGDAQVGNWLSWQDCQWPADDANSACTAADLLKRTVLYKVGHHASHNATLRAKGLELMVSPDLVALVPVNHEMAEKKRWFGMPFPALLARLEEKTQGRILRIDQAMPAKPDGVAPGLWDTFHDMVTENELYFEVRLPAHI